MTDTVRPAPDGAVHTAGGPVEAADVEAFAAALGQDAGPAGPGDVAPLGFAVRAGAPAIVACVERLVRGAGVTGLLQVAHDQHIGRPLVLGEHVTATARVTDRWAVPGGSLVAVSGVLDGDGGPVARSVLTLLVTGLASDGRRSAAAGRAPSPRPGRRGPFTPCGTLALTDRHAAGYARAAGDPNPVHRSAAAARAAGLPGVIVPGLCLLWLAADRVLDRFGVADHAAVARVRCRFAAPAMPGDVLDVLAAPRDDGALAFRLVAPGGAVLKSGSIELHGGRA